MKDDPAPDLPQCIYLDLNFPKKRRAEYEVQFSAPSRTLRPNTTPCAHDFLV